MEEGEEFNQKFSHLLIPCLIVDIVLPSRIFLNVCLSLYLQAISNFIDPPLVFIDSLEETLIPKRVDNFHLLIYIKTTGTLLLEVEVKDPFPDISMV